MADRLHDRRELLEFMGLVAAGAVLGGSVAGCSSVIRRDVAAEPTPGASRLPAHLVSILHDAALAPSSHNSQPWKVVVHAPTRLTLHADLGRTLADVDPTGRELRLSLGAFVENLVVAAGARGVACHVDVGLADDLQQPVADIQLSPGPPTAYPLDRLARRCTIRHGLQSTVLPVDLVTALVGADPSAIHFVPCKALTAAAIREATVEAFRQQTARDSAQREFARWVRFSNSAVRAHRDGLTTASMRIGGLSGWFVRNFYDEDDVMKSGFRRRSIDLTARQVCEAGGWFIVTSRDEHPTSIFDAGRVYERLATLACEHRVGLHPMSQALEEMPYRTQLAERLGVDGVPQFIMRAGLVDSYPEPVTLRRPVSTFTSLHPDRES